MFDIGESGTSVCFSSSVKFGFTQKFASVHSNSIQTTIILPFIAFDISKKFILQIKLLRPLVYFCVCFRRQFWDSVRMKWGHLGVQIYIFIDCIVCRYLYLHFWVSYGLQMTHCLLTWYNTMYALYYHVVCIIVSQLHEIIGKKSLFKPVCILYLPFTHIHQYV